MSTHKYTKYRPPFCRHPPFESIGYCWGLALAADEKRVDKFLAKKCSDCDESRYYKEEAK